MSKKNILFLLVMVITWVGCARKTNWYENFKERSKDPFGLYIVYNEAEDLFDNEKVHYLKENIYDYLNNTYFEENYQFNYVCIKRKANKITEAGIYELLLYVEEGSTAFFSLNYFNSTLKSALGFEVDNMEVSDEFYDSYSPTVLKEYKGELKLTNQSFKDKSYKYDRNLRRNYFTSYNENNTVVLGTQNIDGKDQPTFIKVYHGDGAVYLHTQPSAFSNYNMLNDNYEYAERVLSYLPTKETLWDPQIRRSTLDSNSNSNGDDSDDTGSVFGFFWQNESLKWSLYLGFVALIIFMLFNARRKQRPIPIIHPPNNSTLEFTHTMANMYLLNNDHKNMVDKKIQFFLEKVRSRYYLDTANLNSEFIEKLALKSGNDLSNTKYLINTILKLNRKSECTPEELMTLNKMIDNFLKRK